MAWSTLAGDAAVSQEDVENAELNGYICLLGGQDSFGPTNLGTGHRWVTIEWMSYIAGDGTPTDTQDGGTTRSTNELATKDDIVAWRLWDPGDDIQTSLSGTEGTGLNGGIDWSWTDDSGIPTTDSSWARNDVECVLEVHSNTSFTSLQYTAYINYGVGTRTTVWVGATENQRYYARIRYRNKTNTAYVSDTWEEDTTGAIYGEGIGMT